jgi:hypothetical protein
VFEAFDQMHGLPLDPGGLIFPASKYQHPEILTQLSLMPESEQPSHGWKWFCERYDIDTLGIGPHVGRGWTWSDIRDHSTDRVLRWGFPFWDEDKVEMGAALRYEGGSHSSWQPIPPRPPSTPPNNTTISIS